jgi:hypothetical protein
VREVLRHPRGTVFSVRDSKKSKEHEQRTSSAHSDPSPQQVPREEDNTHHRSNDPTDEPPFSVPSLVSIAGVLIRDWAEGRIPKGAHL